jgi:uncharacterized protein YrrD
VNPKTSCALRLEATPEYPPQKGRNMETLDETAKVISAAKITGTNVYNTAGDLLGEIHDVMIDKRSGKIAYAIMSFGGFLGIGECCLCRCGDRS